MIIPNIWENNPVMFQTTNLPKRLVLEDGSKMVIFRGWASTKVNQQSVHHFFLRRAPYEYKDMWPTNLAWAFSAT